MTVLPNKSPAANAGERHGFVHERPIISRSWPGVGEVWSLGGIARMKTFLAIGGVLFALVALYIGWGYSHSESYCFFSPGIDTQYAAGYSEQAFSQITTGMTVQAVQQKLGAPLYAQTNRENGRLEWYYTLDGKCKWGDWAWLERSVDFADGRVVELHRRIAYD